MLLKEIKVGDLILPNNVFSAPMAGVSDLSFRMMLRDVKPGLVYTEMISDKGILYNNKRTLDMCEILPDEHPIALQLFGYDIDEMVAATKYIEAHNSCDIIDINMGCPVSKVVKTNGGSAHLKTPEHAFALVRAMSAVTSKPISVKLRIGWDSDSINAVEMAQGLEEAGAKLLAVHGRTRSQGYKGAINLDVIKAVKEAVQIPVIGNGEIKSREDALHMMEYTGIDGVMIGRGLLNNPWLIEDIKQAFKGEEFKLDMSDDERLKWLDRHLRTMIENLGEDLAIRKMRGYASWFVAGFKNARTLKQEFIRMNSYAEFDKIVQGYCIERNGES